MFIFHTYMRPTFLNMLKNQITFSDQIPEVQPAFVYNRQLTALLMFVRFISKFLCMCTYCTALAQEVWGKSDIEQGGLWAVHKSCTSTILKLFDSSKKYPCICNSCFWFPALHHFFKNPSHCKSLCSLFSSFYYRVSCFL